MNSRFRRIIKWSVIGAVLCLPVGYFVYQAGWLGSEYSRLVTPPAEIKGNVITLRALKEDHFLDFHNMFSSTVRKAMEFPETISLNYTIRMLKLELEKISQRKTLYYVVFDNKDDKLIGYVEVREKNPADPGQFGFWVNENYWGGGRAVEAAQLIARTYFRLYPDKNSFTAHVRLWNHRSYGALKKSGFKETGYFYEDGAPTRHIMEYSRK
jgi:RimJ/RimL family protein N-acetyltransferase